MGENKGTFPGGSSNLLENNPIKTIKIRKEKAKTLHPDLSLDLARRSAFTYRLFPDLKVSTINSKKVYPSNFFTAFFMEEASIPYFLMSSSGSPERGKSLIQRWITRVPLRACITASPRPPF